MSHIVPEYLQQSKMIFKLTYEKIFLFCFQKYHWEKNKLLRIIFLCVPEISFKEKKIKERVGKKAEGEKKRMRQN